MLLRSSAELSAFRLLVLATVVEQQGFSAAAGQLQLSQPSVSFHIRALERAFGTKLVIYQNRRVELTAEGEVVYASAKSILRELDELDDAVHKLLTAQSGSLRMGAAINFEQAYFFARVIGPFRERHPDVRFSIQYGHSYQLADLVAQRQSTSPTCWISTCQREFSTNRCTRLISYFSRPQNIPLPASRLWIRTRLLPRV